MKDNIKILIADDHPLMLQGLKMVLNDVEWCSNCEQAKDGEEAYSKLISGNFDVAVLDVEMPKLSGLEIARKISAIKTETKIIFLTMYKDEDLFNEAMDCGAKGFVLKENAVNDIINCISEVLEGNYYISPLISGYLVKHLNKQNNLEKIAPSINNLTISERRILKLISENKTSKEIAEEFSISAKTVENHRNNISKKLNLQGSHSLLKFAITNKHLM
jgi:two-component system, NarL family, response regulator DegU